MIVRANNEMIEALYVPGHDEMMARRLTPTGAIDTQWQPARHMDWLPNSDGHDFCPINRIGHKHTPDGVSMAFLRRDWDSHQWEIVLDGVVVSTLGPEVGTVQAWEMARALVAPQGYLASWQHAAWAGRGVGAAEYEACPECT